MLLQLYSVTAVTQCYFCFAVLLQLYSITLVFQCYWNSNILTNPSDSETALLLCNETHRVDDYNSAWETFMAATRTIVKKSNLVLWSVVGKDLEPRYDGLLCPHQYLRLGSQLFSVCNSVLSGRCYALHYTRDSSHEPCSFRIPYGLG